MEMQIEKFITVIYNGKDNKDAVRWGSNDDPFGLLVANRKYVVERMEVHSWHTKVFLKEFPGKKFNSVHFKFEP